MKKKKKQNRDFPKELDLPTLTAMNSIMTDPNGSYTGVPKNKHDKPVQDVDDL